MNILIAMLFFQIIIIIALSILVNNQNGYKYENFLNISSVKYSRGYFNPSKVANYFGQYTPKWKGVKKYP